MSELNAQIDKLENYPGYPNPISGYEFSQKMEEQAVKFGAEIKYGTVKSIKKENKCKWMQTVNR